MGSCARSFGDTESENFGDTESDMAANDKSAQDFVTNDEADRKELSYMEDIMLNGIKERRFVEH